MKQAQILIFFKKYLVVLCVFWVNCVKTVALVLRRILGQFILGFSDEAIAKESVQLFSSFLRWKLTIRIKQDFHL